MVFPRDDPVRTGRSETAERALIRPIPSPNALVPPLAKKLRSEIIDLFGTNVSSSRCDETILFCDETIFRFCADNRKQR